MRAARRCDAWPGSASRRPFPWCRPAPLRTRRAPRSWSRPERRWRRPRGGWPSSPPCRCPRPAPPPKSSAMRSGSVSPRSSAPISWPCRCSRWPSRLRWSQSVADRLALHGDDPLAVDTWFARMERIREPLSKLSLALRAGRGAPHARIAAAGRGPAAASRRPALGRRRAERRGAAARRSTVARPADGRQARPDPATGRAADRRVGRDRAERAARRPAITFQYDAPDAFAPQAILFAVPPVLGRPWTQGDLNRVLLETLELAKLRAVDPAALGEIAHCLPALHFAFNVGRRRRVDGLRPAGALTDAVHHDLDPSRAAVAQRRCRRRRAPRASTTRSGCWRASGRWASSRARTPARRWWRAGAAESRRCRAATWARSRRTPACRPRAYDPATLPLETMVERQPLPQAVAAAPGADGLRRAVDAGQHFLRLLALQPILGATIARRSSRPTPCRRSTPASGPGSMPTRWRSPTSLPGARSTGVACAPRSTPAASRRSTPRCRSARPIGPRSRTPARRGSTWCDTLFSTPAPAQDAWQRERMEYAFSVAARVSEDALRRAHPECGRVLRRPARLARLRRERGGHAGRHGRPRRARASCAP